MKKNLNKLNRVIEFKKKILITSALPYVNNVPHLGNMVCILSADVFARFLRIMGEQVISVLGTDEHGTTTEAIAMKMGLTPKQATDHFFKIHTEIYGWFNCGFDCYGRTSSKENIEITQDIFKKLYKNGFIVERDTEQMFDEEAKKFLSDRFIEGTCPYCGYKDARGDQCESCGKLLNPTELLNPKSKLTGSKPIIKKTKHLFIALDKLQPKLEKFIEKKEKEWSENAKTTTHAWLKEGLQERAITRDLKWGIQVPLKGYEDKVFYVWFDAPIGYISITKEHRKDWHDLWHNPEKVKLVQFMGKDNIPFHTILFPASLLGTEDNYTLIDTLSVNEYLNYEDGKFSKSRNQGVFGDDAKNLGFPADVWRYYLMINRPESSDTAFTWDDFGDKLNSDLVGNFGNLVNRTLAFVARFMNGDIKNILIPSDSLDYKEDIKEIINAYEHIELKKATKLIMSLSRKGNQYFQEQQPWKTIKENPAKAENAVAVLANLIKDLSVLIQPIMPEIAVQLQKQLGLKPEFSLKMLEKPIKNHKIGEHKALFRKIEDKEIAVLKEKFSGKKAEEVPESSDRFDGLDSSGSSDSLYKFLKQIDLRIAKIVAVKRHPEAEKLYIEEIDLGDEKRTIVSGLVPYYKEDELLGKNIILVYNLKPAKLRGVLSKGMLLAAGKGDDVGILHCPQGNPGERIVFEGIKQEESDLSKEISVEDFFKVEFKSEKGAVFAGGHKLNCKGKIIVDKNIEGKIK